MSNTSKERPAPMTREEYERRHADACVKADVVPGPVAGLRCDEAVDAGVESVGGGEVRESPGAGSA